MKLKNPTQKESNCKICYLDWSATRLSWTVPVCWILDHAQSLVQMERNFFYMTINSEYVATYNSDKTSLNQRIMLGKYECLPWYVFCFVCQKNVQENNYIQLSPKKHYTQLRFAQGYENTMPLTIYKFSLTCAYICSYLPLHKTTKMLVQNAVVISTIGQELALKKREGRTVRKIVWLGYLCTC